MKLQRKKKVRFVKQKLFLRLGVFLLVTSSLSSTATLLIRCSWFLLELKKKVKPKTELIIPSFLMGSFYLSFYSKQKTRKKKNMQCFHANCGTFKSNGTIHKNIWNEYPETDIFVLRNSKIEQILLACEIALLFLDFSLINN